MLHSAQRDHREFKGIRPHPATWPVQILFHSGRSCVLPPSPAAWRGHVARRDLQQVKEARREAAICIQSGKRRVLRRSSGRSFLLDFLRVSDASSTFFFEPPPLSPFPPLVLPAYMLRRKRDKGPPEKRGKKKPSIFVKHLFDLDEWPAKQ